MAEGHVRVFDTTLRDGEQAPGFSLRPAEKLQLARQIDALGVDIIEAGFPIASPADAEAVRQIATEVRRPVIACLARCHRADLEKAAWAIKPAAQGRIHTFIATSDLHLKVKLRMSREQCLEAAVESVQKRTTSGQRDAVNNEVCDQFRRRALNRLVNRSEDCLDRAGDRITDLDAAHLYRFGHPRRQVPAAHDHRNLVVHRKG